MRCNKMFCVVLIFMAGMFFVKPQLCAASTADVLYSLGDLFNSADQARAAYERHRNGRDAARYEREWRQREYQLEEARIDRMAKESRLSPYEIRSMRERGLGWDAIARDRHLDPKIVDYGRHGYGGYDRDHNRGFYQHYYKEYPGKNRGHYKGSYDGPPGHYKHGDKPPKKFAKYVKYVKHDKKYDKHDKHGKGPK